MVKKTSHGRLRSSKETAPLLEVSKSFKVKNELGLHARAAALFVKEASRFRSEIKVRKGSQEVNGKSIMGLLMLAAARGSEIYIHAAGADASQALKGLGDLIEAQFCEK